MDFLSGFVIEGVKMVISPIARRIRNVYKFNSNVDKLKQQAEELGLKKRSVEADVEEAERQGGTVKEEVLRWMRKVEEFNDSVANITNQEGRLSCTNVKMRFSHSTKAIELFKECAVLLTEGNFLRVTNYNPPLITKSMCVRDDDNFDSRNSIFGEIMKDLKDAQFKTIGVYGMGGVGKTTLVKKVFFQAKEERLFNQVVKAEVTQNADLRNVQAEIADHLGLHLQEEGLDTRAARLHERLKKENSVLVILDDVWTELDLNAIGIPSGGADKRNCTILLSSRDLKVCNIMMSEKNIYVMPLSPEEALKLFWSIVGDSEENIEYETTAAKIVEKCAGLPVAILTIAKTLKHEGHTIWEEVLHNLLSFDFHGVEKDFHSVIELSYSFIKNSEAKSLFLLCSLFKVGHFIDVECLVRYGSGLGLFRNVNTLKAVRGKVDILIKYLKAASLLLEDDRKDVVKVHDVIHVVAQRIALRDDYMFNLQDVNNLEEELERDIYKDSKAIVLDLTEEFDLLHIPEFPQLKLLMLQFDSWSYDRLYLEIPDQFFDRMKELKVLGFTGVHLPWFIPSLDYLTNLHTLSLYNCRIRDIKNVGKLKKLEVLSFSNSNIKKLPEEIGGLTRLKLLDLEDCLDLAVIPPNVLSRLTRLEELYMPDTFSRWDVQGNASLTEFKKLDRLTILNIYISDAHIIPPDWFTDKLERYSIIIGEFHGFGISKQSRTLKIELNGENYLECGVKKLFKNTEVLHLVELNGLENVHPELGGEGFPDLKQLRVHNSSRILHIAKQDEVGHYNVFPVLESLHLHNMIALEKLCCGQLRAESFSVLKIINVADCNALTHLISCSMVKTLQHLEEIEVMSCNSIEEIVDKESEEHDVKTTEIVFAKLQKLELRWLEKLTNIGPTASREAHEISHVDLSAFFNNKVSFPRLENLNMVALNIKRIWCYHPLVVSSFGQTLRSLVLQECHNLKFIFSSSMIDGLQQLEELAIEDCSSMEVVITTEGLREENSNDKILFPSLKQIQIKSCPNLKTFSSQMARNNPVMIPKLGDVDAFFDDEKIVLPALEKLQLSNVNSSKYLFTSSLVLSLLQLEELELVDCAKIKEITTREVEKEAAGGKIIPKLQCLKLDGLPELERFCRFKGHVVELSSLSELQITRCPNLRTFISDSVSLDLSPSTKPDKLNSPENFHGDMIPLFDEKILLPKLESLQIEEMDNLRRLWQNVLCPSSFSSLKELCITSCESLPSVFPHNMLDIIKRLDRLMLSHCNSLEGVFGVSKRSCSMVEKTIPRFEFPKLTKLELNWLPRLKSLYPGLHISEWPALEELRIVGCEKVEIFGSELQSLHEESQLLISIPQPLFVVEKNAFPRLEELELTYNDSLKEIWYGEFSGHPLTLKSFSFVFNPKITNLPFHFLAAKELVLSSSQCEQIVSSEGVDFEITHAHALSQLRRLELRGGWVENSGISDCLKCMVPSWASFRNLTDLTIYNCNKFKSLLTYSIAKSLQQLTRLTVSNCEMIEEIITRPMDEGTDPIIFNKLESSTLHRLRSLTGFYLGDHTLEFPSLEQVIVQECPYMKVFSEGDLITPQLQSVQLNNREDWEELRPTRWEGDLNNTIQVMFKEMVGFNQLYDIRLSEHPRLQEIWHGQIPVSFDRLSELSVDNCANISSAIRVKHLPFLKGLGSLSVEDCDSLEEVFNLEGLNADGNSHLLPELFNFRLIELPRLRNIWSKSQLEILGFRDLRCLYVCKCDSLPHIFTTTIILGLVQLKGVEIKDCALVEAIITEDAEKDAATNSVIVPLLNTMSLESLPKLISVYQGSNILECSSLETITITDCPQMKTFVFTSTKVLDLHDAPFFSKNVELPALEILKLSKLPEVVHLSKESSKLFQNLRKLKISDCGKLKSLLPSSACLEKLKTLKVSKCDSLTSIMTFSTAKSLKKLAKINVADSKMIEEIITHIGGEESDQVVFGQLKYLGLHCLPSITGFYLGGCAIHSSALEQVIVRECRKMNTFSHGDVSIPKLQRLQYTESEDDWCWNGDLNTTIRQLSNEMNDQTST